MIRNRSSLMSVRWVRLLLCALIAVALVIGCSDDGTDPAVEIADTHKMNPNANQLIVDEVIGPDEDRNSSVWELLERPGGGYVFRGYYGSHWVIGSVSSSNVIDWSRRTYFSPSGFGMTPDDIPGLSGLIFVSGSKDFDDDGRYDAGVVSVIEPGGELIDELTWEDPTDALRFDDIIFDGVDSGGVRFLVVGALSGEDKVYHPMCATIHLSADTTLQKVNRYDFTDVSNKRFREATRNPAPSKDGYILTGGSYGTEGDLDHSMVFFVDTNMKIEAQIDIDTGAGLRNNIGFGFHDAATADTVYCVGHTEVQRTSSSGLYWRGGAIVALSTAGGIYWVRTYDISPWVEEFDDCQLVNGILYAGGVFASYTNSGRQFGYGWLAKIDPVNGNVISSHYFGDNHWTSGVNSVAFAGQSVVVGGYTRYKEYGGDYSYWIVELDAAGRSKDDGLLSWDSGARNAEHEHDGRVPPEPIRNLGDDRY